MTALTPDLEALLDEAPHHDLCTVGFVPKGAGQPLGCSCWKGPLVAGVRSRDERITELETEKTAAESERDGYALAIKALADMDDEDAPLERRSLYAFMEYNSSLPAVVARVMREAKAEALEEAAVISEGYWQVDEDVFSDGITDALRARAAEYRKETK